MSGLATALLHRGVIDVAALDRAAAQQEVSGRSLAQVLLADGAVTEAAESASVSANR